MDSNSVNAVGKLMKYVFLTSMSPFSLEYLIIEIL